MEPGRIVCTRLCYTVGERILDRMRKIALSKKSPNESKKRIKSNQRKRMSDYSISENKRRYQSERMRTRKRRMGEKSNQDKRGLHLFVRPLKPSRMTTHIEVVQTRSLISSAVRIKRPPGCEPGSPGTLRL